MAGANTVILGPYASRCQLPAGPTIDATPTLPNSPKVVFALNSDDELCPITVSMRNDTQVFSPIADSNCMPPDLRSVLEDNHKFTIAAETGLTKTEFGGVTVTLNLLKPPSGNDVVLIPCSDPAAANPNRVNRYLREEPQAIMIVATNAADPSEP